MPLLSHIASHAFRLGEPFTAYKPHNRPTPHIVSIYNSTYAAFSGQIGIVVPFFMSTVSLSLFIAYCSLCTLNIPASIRPMCNLLYICTWIYSGLFSMVIVTSITIEQSHGNKEHARIQLFKGKIKRNHHILHINC